MSADYVKISTGTVPRIIEDFAYQINGKLNDSFKGSTNRKWLICGINCTCGNINLRIKGNGLKKTDYLGSSIKIECKNCEKEFEIFNNYNQGYDGELGNYEESDTVDLEYENLKCKKCGSDTFEFALGFEYALYEDEIADFEKEVKDLFTWLLGFVKCTHCGCIRQVVDLECA